jgi:hypothetical protein
VPVNIVRRKELKRVESVSYVYSCDRCGKDLPKNEDTNDVDQAGFFIPTFPWGSKYCDTQYELNQVVLCDDCWDAFYSSFVFDHVKRHPEEER